jgi:hypothetical protein
MPNSSTKDHKIPKNDLLLSTLKPELTKVWLPVFDPSEVANSVQEITDRATGKCDFARRCISGKPKLTNR